MKVLLSTVLLLFILCSCGKKSTDKADLTHPDLPQEPSKTLQLDEEEHNKLKTLKYQLVEGYENKKPFYVLEREDKIKQFKCSSCHDKPLPERPTGVFAQSTHAHRLEAQSRFRCRHGLSFLPQ